MWNLNRMFNNTNNEITQSYNLLFHELKNKILDYQNKKFKITNVFKEWKSGWYLSLELEESPTQEEYIRIPFLNINCTDQDTSERIELVRKLVKISEEKE